MGDVLYTGTPEKCRELMGQLKSGELTEGDVKQLYAKAQETAQTTGQDKDTFSIYQIKGGDETRDFRFEPYDRLQAAGNVVDKANYELVYSAPLAPETSLEDIYTRFNIDHPKDFKGHSLSVSDVVVLHQNGQDTAHYVDSVGFRQVPEFLQEQKQLTPDELTTGETIQTPRGTFHVTAMSREQIEAAGYGFHHQSDDGKYLIMGNGTRAFAVAAEQPEKANPFNRPAFQRMIADIEAGKIGCVITKDLSRLGRNYIEAGSYIEIFFPKHNVGCKVCSSHKIEARDLYNLVLKDIQELAAQAMKDADAFYQHLSSRMERRYLVDASQTEKERKRLEARNQEIDVMFLSLYTDKAKGILTEQRFMKLTAALEQEQESNQKRLHDLAMMQSRADAQESEVRTFIKEIRRYSAIEELDEAMLNQLISRILIGEVKKVDGQKVQKVKIVYNFVGEIPEIAA